jgi:AraC-like DNA-binding protein
VRVEAGRLCVFWALQPHQIIHFEGEASYYVATVPFSRFLQWQMPAAFLNQIMAGSVLQDPSTSAACLDKAMFERWLQDLASGSRETIAITMLEMEARIRRLALATKVNGNHAVRSRTGDIPIPEQGASKVEQMTTFIAANYREPILVRDIGKAVGLHPDYANALFRATFGVTLSDYLLGHRIAHAERMLATSNETVTCIAFASGFGSISRFNAAFKSSSGCTPTEYRRQHHRDGD